MSFCRILEKDWVNWRKVSQGKLACIVLYCIVLYRSTIAFTRPYSTLWGCAGDRVELVGKVHRGTVLGDAFSTCSKFILQNGPTTHLTTISTRSPAQPQSGEFELFPPVHTKGNTIACLTGHALFNVWHHRIRKPPFSSVHTRTMDRRFQKSPHWRAFRNVRFRWPSSLLHWIRADRWPNRRKNKTHTCGRGLNLLLYDFTATGAKTSHKNCIRTASNFFALIPSRSFCPGNVGFFVDSNSDCRLYLGI